MILLLGDIHGNVSVLERAITIAHEVEAAAIIQVGDFGLFPKGGIDTGFHRVCKEARIPIYFIEGNHDDCSRWVRLEAVTRIWEDANLYYIPRGTVMEIDGRTIAFMGGAASIDKGIRLHEGWHWDENENISPHEVLRLFENAEGKQIDMLITHDVPLSVCATHFDDGAKLWFGVGRDWVDVNMLVIERIWERLKYPPIYSGHMHRSVFGPNYRILNIDELLAV